MATRKKGREESAVLLPQDEAIRIAQETLRRVPALNRTQLKKALPPSFKKQSELILSALRELAATGTIHHWQSKSAEWFFLHDPISTLLTTSRTLLRERALPATELQKLIAQETLIPRALFTEWQKGALQRGELFQITESSSGTNTQRKRKLLSLHPDLPSIFKKALLAFQKPLLSLDAQGVSRKTIADFLLEQLGLPSPTSHIVPPEPHETEAPQAARPLFLQALQKLSAQSPPGSLLAVSDLRARVPLDKAQFDQVALQLAQEGTLDLHYHDHPQALPPAEREALIQDNAGTHYIGVVLRTPQKAPAHD